MAVQINIAQIREKYPELVSAFTAIQQAMNAPAAPVTPPVTAPTDTK